MSRRNTMNAVREHSRVTVLGGNNTEILWWQTLLGHFRMTITFQMLCNEIVLLVSQVLPYHSAKSHDFFLHMDEFIRQIYLHLPLFALTIFLTSQKPPQVSVKTFWWIKFFFSKFGISITHFWCDTSKCALKQGDGNIATVLQSLAPTPIKHIWTS